MSFPIIVEIDPSKASPSSAGARAVEQTLTGFERRAADAGRSIEQSLAQAFRNASQRGRDASGRFLPGGGSGGNRPTLGGGGDSGRADAIAAERKEIQQEILALQREAELLHLSADARAVATQQMAVEESLRQRGVALTVEESLSLRQLVGEKQALAGANARTSAELEREQAILQSIHGPAERHRADMAALHALYQRGQVSASQYRQQVDRLNHELAESQRQGARGGFGVQDLAVVGGAALGAVYAIKKFTDLSDTVTNLDNRLSAVTASSSELASVQQALGDIADETRSSYDAVTELYTRTSGAAKSLYLSQGEVLDFTEQLTKAIKLSGKAGQEAEAGMIQLAQGIASGRLQGDELRSVLENIPVVADIIAKHFGVTRGELRAMGAEGKISANDIIAAFREAGDDIERNFGARQETYADRWTVAKNKAVDAARGIRDAFAEIDEVQGAGGSLGEAAFRGVDKQLTELTLKYQAHKDARADVTKAQQEGLVARNREIATMAREAGAWADLANGVRLYRAFYDEMIERRASARNALFGSQGIEASAAELIGGSFQAAAEGARNAAKASLDEIKKFKDAEEEAAREAEAFRDRLTNLAREAQPTRAAMADLALAEQDLARGLAEGRISLDAYNRILEATRENYRDLIDPVQAYLDAAAREIELLKLTNEERELSVEIQKAEEAARAAGGVGLLKQIELMQRAYDLQQARNEAAEREKRAGELLDPYADTERKTDAMARYREQIRGLTDDTEQASRAFGDNFAKAVESAGLSLAELFLNGELSGKTFVDTLLKEFLRLGEAEILKQLANFFSGNKGTTTLFGDGGGGPPGLTQSTGGAAGFFGELAGLLGGGFAEGGSFIARGAPGRDKNVAIFRIGDGERVDITPAATPTSTPAPAAAPPTVITNVIADPRELVGGVVSSPRVRRHITNITFDPTVQRLLRRQK